MRGKIVGKANREDVMTDSCAPNRPASGLAPCCLQTVEAHGKNNTMMTCPVCEKIIKYFTDTTAFHNYRKFCISRKREFALEESKNYHLIAFDRPV